MKNVGFNPCWCCHQQPSRKVVNLQLDKVIFGSTASEVATSSLVWKEFMFALNLKSKQPIYCNALQSATTDFAKLSTILYLKTKFD